MSGGHDAAVSLDAERERNDVEQQQLLRLLPARISAWIAAPCATTSSGWTEVFGSRPKISCAMAWTSGKRVGPPTRIDVGKLLALEPGIAERAQAGLARALEKRARKPFELRARDGAAVIARARAVERGQLELDRGARRGGKRDLGAFRGFEQRRQKLAILGGVDAERALISPAQTSAMARSRSSPPSAVSPLVASTSKIPS